MGPAPDRLAKGPQPLGGASISLWAGHPTGGVTESAAMVSSVRASARPEKFG